jgi:hypothetical protein
LPKRTYYGCCAMITAFQAAFLVIGLTRVPVPWYHPLEHGWRLEVFPRGLAMNFYGEVLYATIAAALAYPAGWLLGARSRGPLNREQAWLALGYALVGLALAMAMIAFQIWPRHGTPLPLPRWYVPR